MNRLFPLAFVLVLAGCTGHGGAGSVSQVRPGMLALAADVAQNRMAQDEGAIAALSATAASDAVLLAPGPVVASDWLDARESFPPSKWRGHKVMASCDGYTGVVTGGIEWDGTPGYYTTVWQYRGVDADRNDDGRGEWRWVLSHGDGLERARPAPQYPIVEVASCDNIPAVDTSKITGGFSPDGSLRYRWSFDPALGRTLTVELWDGTQFRTALEDIVGIAQED